MTAGTATATAVEITGPAIPRLSRKELVLFVRRTLWAVERLNAASFLPSEVSVAFVRDAEMKRLNRRFRGKAGTTDILTFPGEAPELVISVDQAKRQARRERHSLATEIRYLVVHGILHGFGHDHETDRGEMNALELRIRDLLGL